MLRSQGSTTGRRRTHLALEQKARICCTALFDAFSARPSTTGFSASVAHTLRVHAALAIRWLALLCACLSVALTSADENKTEETFWVDLETFPCENFCGSEHYTEIIDCRWQFSRPARYLARLKTYRADQIALINATAAPTVAPTLRRPVQQGTDKAQESDGGLKESDFHLDDAYGSESGGVGMMTSLEFVRVYVRAGCSCAAFGHQGWIWEYSRTSDEWTAAEGLCPRFVATKDTSSSAPTFSPTNFEELQAGGFAEKATSTGSRNFDPVSACINRNESQPDDFGKLDSRCRCCRTTCCPADRQPCYRHAKVFFPREARSDYPVPCEVQHIAGGPLATVHDEARHVVPTAEQTVLATDHSPTYQNTVESAIDEPRDSPGLALDFLGEMKTNPTWAYKPTRLASDKAVGGYDVCTECNTEKWSKSAIFGNDGIATPHQGPLNNPDALNYALAPDTAGTAGN